MGRLSDKLSRASDAIARFEDATEKDVDKLIARTEELHEKREKVFLRKHMALDGHMTDLHEFERELDAFDNGAPPLSDGANTDEVGERKAWQPPKS